MKITKALRQNIFAAVLFVLCTSASAKSLYWPSIEVKAHLNENGDLATTELQTFSFDGDWNGGERIFRVSNGEKFQFLSLSKIDPMSGKAQKMIGGTTSLVDHFDWVNKYKLRWRSRNPSDPLFNKTQITYEIKYVLSNILRKREHGYTLNHDFLFPDRSGPVENFRLTLTLDPAWKSLIKSPMVLTRQNLEAGKSVFVQLDLEHIGTAAVGANDSLSKDTRVKILFSVSLFVLISLIVAFIRRESRLDRFQPIAPASQVDHKFIKEHMLSLLPAQVGALWDGKVGNDEVSAVLARLVSEDKIKAELVPDSGFIFKILPFLRKKMMRFTLSIDRKNFDGYEKKLIAKMFVGGNQTADRHSIRKYYSSKNKSFNLVTTLGDKFKKSMRRRRRYKDSGFSPYYSVIIHSTWIAFFILLALIFFLHGFDQVTTIFPTSFMLLFFGANASFYAKMFVAARLDSPVIVGLKSVLIMASPFGLCFLADNLFNEANSMLLLPYLATIILAVAISLWLYECVSTNNSAKKISDRRSLYAIRNYFVLELKKPQPNIEDKWFPYLIAFGLARKMDRWSYSYCASTATTSSYATSTLAGSSSWTGGGQFSGAGASGAWVAATSSVSASATSSSSSSSGGGGGSSGGGGGGGW